MREIKFRGWYDAGEFSSWKYGYLVERYDPDGENLLWYIVNENYKGWEVDPKSVGQYTGLKDKNGKEIYENDVVKFRSVFHNRDDIGVIKWVSNGFYIIGQRDNDVVLHPDNTQYIEVIGNIYENPELIKRQN